MAAQKLFAGVGRITQLVLERGQGSYVWASNGKKYLDFTSGIGVTSTGHCHPKVTAAVVKQASTIVHAQVNIGYNATMLQLVEQLQTIFPPDLDSFFFGTTGAEAVENAVKLARQATGKPNVVVMQGGFHGRSLGAMSLTTSKTIYRSRFGPGIPGVHVTPFPYCLHCDCKPAASDGPCCLKPIAALEELLKQQTSPEETCAVLIEPVLGEGGYVFAGKEFMQQLRALCDKHKMLLIADEVQCGVGRTGDWFVATNHYGVVPDILVFAKGIASGFPLSGLAAKSEFSRVQPAGSMGGTYAGNAVSCAAAIATLQVIKEENLLHNAVARGAQLMQGLQALQQQYPKLIRDVRGKGLMVGLEFHPQLSGLAAAVSKGSAEHGMLLLPTSIYEVVRFIPPLTVAQQEVEQCLDVMGTVLKELAQRFGAE
eukprot:m.101868 g.101868  ORF g.101868 m.101868 type:complete len:426 (+) comp18743_c0_seq1:24-1301(+)